MKALLYDWSGLNVWLFKVVNGFHSDAWDHCMLLASQLAEHGKFGLYLGLISLAALVAVRMGGKRALQAWFGVIVVFAMGYVVDGWVVGMLKEWFSFPRPLLALPLGSVHLVGQPEFNLQHSLPSGHASFAMLVAASLWPVLNRFGRYAAAGFVLWVGLSRISLGVHFPADVVAGALSCLLVVWLTRKLAYWAIR